MKKYAVAIERWSNNMSACVPDLPGCVTTGKTVEEIERNIREAIELHLEGMAEDGGPVPVRLFGKKLTARAAQCAQRTGAHAGDLPLSFSEDLAYGLLQAWKVPLDHRPCRVQIDTKVLVYQDIAAHELRSA